MVATLVEELELQRIRKLWRRIDQTHVHNKAIMPTCLVRNKNSEAQWRLAKEVQRQIHIHSMRGNNRNKR